MYLNGIPGERLEQKLAGGIWMTIREIESHPGKDLQTTLDIRFQDIAEKSLAAASKADTSAFAANVRASSFNKKVHKRCKQGARDARPDAFHSALKLKRVICRR